MNDHEYRAVIERMPPWVILHLPEVTRQFKGFFGPFAEYAFHLAFIILMDRTQYHHVMHKATKRLIDHLVAELEARQDLEYDAEGFTMDFKPLFMEHLLAFERGVQDIRAELQRLGAMINQRYIPYDFQSILPNGDLLIERIGHLRMLEDWVAD